MPLSILPPPRFCNPQRHSSPFLLPPRTTLRLPAKFCSLNSFASHDGGAQDEYVVGDCLVFEEGAFNDPYLKSDSGFEHFDSNPRVTRTITKAKQKMVSSEEIEPQKLVPDQWNHVLEEVNITKKERRRIAQQLEFGSKVEKKRKGLVPIRNVNLQEYLKVKETKLAQANPVVLEASQSKTVGGLRKGELKRPPSGERVAPKNPRWAVYGKGFDDLAEFFSSGRYEPGEKKSDGPRKLFSKEEKVLLNQRVPDLAAATSGKWLPLHTLAASGEFYLVDQLLKHSVDINSLDKDGLTAIHKAIIGKKQAVTNYLLRESANPFVRDKDGATLIHYAVRTASTHAIKVLLLYNLDINLQDDDGWTPLHLAVQARRTDVVKLLLIKGADKTLKNKDGLTPLELCLYSGQDIRTYELIKLLKQIPKKPKQLPLDQHAQ